MEHLLNTIEKNLNNNLLVITVSNPRRAEEVRRYTVRPVLIRDQLLFQMTSHTKTQVFHNNLAKEDLLRELANILPAYKQLQLETTELSMQALINKKGKAAIRIKPGEKKNGAGQKQPLLSHNRKKKYILEEGIPVPFLRDLGVMTEEGKIVHARYDKFRQINRFLEFIEDILVHLPHDREITIIDFGCGKSYLTFAVYYYLHQLRSLPVHIIGLDLKDEVIRHCRQLAIKYGYDRLDFYSGSIEDFEGVSQVDMVITLHACDTATDYALNKAVLWGAKVILSVPCCQHELNRQFDNDCFGPIADFGILKERFAALATDGIRASLLESVGYDTQILEFIDMEHTPKNLLIRAVKKRKPSTAKWKETEDFCRQFHFDPVLKKLLKTERNNPG